MKEWFISDDTALAFLAECTVQDGKVNGTEKFTYRVHNISGRDDKLINPTSKTSVW